MCAKMAFQHQAGTAMECLSVSNWYCVIAFSGFNRLLTHYLAGNPIGPI